MIKHVILNNTDKLTVTAEKAGNLYFYQPSEGEEDDDVITVRVSVNIPAEIKNDSIAICAYIRKVLFNYEITNNTELSGFEPMLRIEK